MYVASMCILDTIRGVIGRPHPDGLARHDMIVTTCDNGSMATLQPTHCIYGDKCTCVELTVKLAPRRDSVIRHIDTAMNLPKVSWNIRQILATSLSYIY